MLAIALLLIGILSRMIFHAPNFTPVLALALFGGMTLKKEQALWMPLALMAVSDLIIGLHDMIALTWGSIFLISLLGLWQRQHRGAGRILMMSVFSSAVFFVVTNFGAWLIMYPKTVQGFIECYMLAVPFFRNTLAGTVVYSGVLFGIYELTARRVRGTRLAWMAEG